MNNTLSSTRIFLVFFLSVLFTGCNLPAATPPADPVAETASALAAGTLTAMAETSAAPTQTLAPTATTTETPTPEAASLVINANTNCRSGPGQDYEVLTVLQPGFTSPIYGKIKDRDYWLVNSPNGGQCWAYGEFATFQGGFASAPELTPPPTATASLPAAPRALRYNYVCTFTDVTTSLTWTDASNNETGFRVYRNGELIADLAAGSAAYTDISTASPGAGFTYSVEAYNVTGASPQATIGFNCP